MNSVVLNEEEILLIREWFDVSNSKYVEDEEYIHLALKLFGDKVYE
jgi:hypothetical protein